MHILPQLFNIVVQVLVKAIKQEKMKVIQFMNGKINLSVFADYKTLYIKTPNTQPRLLGIKNKYSNVIADKFKFYTPTYSPLYIFL